MSLYTGNTEYVLSSGEISDYRWWYSHLNDINIPSLGIYTLPCWVWPRTLNSKILLSTPSLQAQTQVESHLQALSMSLTQLCLLQSPTTCSAPVRILAQDCHTVPSVHVSPPSPDRSHIVSSLASGQAWIQIYVFFGWVWPKSLDFCCLLGFL